MVKKNMGTEGWIRFHNLNLVGGFNPSEKINQLGLLSPIYGKIKMFQTTNQYQPVTCSGYDGQPLK